MTYKITNANIKDWARDYQGEPFDAILCDPPYELGFMGKSWDSSGIAFDKDMWADLLRILKPGGHLLAFSGSRTYHRMACAIEDAGFEIRDMIEWVYGSGFPKSLNIGKALDKNNGKSDVDLKPFGEYIRERRELKGYSRKQLDEIMGTNTAVSWWEGRLSGVQLPSKSTYQKLKPILELDGRFDELIDWAEAEREVIGKKTSGIANKDEGQRYTIGASKSVEVDITLPSTDNAKIWEGYGTALKPAHEPCVLARKPIEGTVAQNALKYGTGGLNIDGSRVGTEQREYSGAGGTNTTMVKGAWGSGEGKDNVYTATGRFPANLIHDGSDEVVGLFPNDNARFFYCSKASKSERNAGLEGFDNHKPMYESHRPNYENTKGIETPYAGAGRTGNANQNHHPTVKPLSLTKYLANLIKPPTGGRLLVPFSGSGSEMIGALQAGWEYVEGVELTEEYIPIAEARIKYWMELKDNEVEQIKLI